MDQRHGYTTQTKARKAALDILYQGELRGASVSETFAEQRSYLGSPTRELTTRIVLGVAEHGAEIDRRIAAAAPPAWPLERMPAIDRNLARIAIFEIDHSDVPPGAVIAEAIRLAADLSTDESAAFLNGLLAKALADKPTTN